LKTGSHGTIRNTDRDTTGEYIDWLIAMQPTRGNQRKKTKDDFIFDYYQNLLQAYIRHKQY
jgi:hypothetical protein